MITMQPKRVLRSAKTVEMAAKKEETKEEIKEETKETKPVAEPPAEPKAETEDSLFDDEEKAPELRKTRRRCEGRRRM